MSKAKDLAADVPRLLRDVVVPFSDGKVVISSVALVDPRDDAVTVRVQYAVDHMPQPPFEFEVDESWGFDTTRDVIAQLQIDLVEHVDTQEK